MGVRMRLSIGLAVATVVGSVAMSVAPAAATPKVIVVGPGGVQAALNAAKPGDTVKLETGVYAEQMIVKSDGVTLDGSGAGPGGSLLNWPAVPLAPGTSCVVCIGGNADTIRDLKIDLSTSPPNQNTFNPTLGIATVNNPTGTTVEEVTVVGNGMSASDGIFLAGRNGTVRDTQSSGLFVAIGVTLVGGAVADNATSGDCLAIDVIDLAAIGLPAPPGLSSNVTVDGNRVQGPETCFYAPPPAFYAGGGISLNGSPHSTVRDNRISGINDAAIFADAPYDAIVDNTVVDSCLGALVLNDANPAQGVDGAADHDTIRGNEVGGNPAAGCYSVGGGPFSSGIRLDGATKTTATGNEIRVSVPTPPASGPVDGLLVETSFANPAATPLNVRVTANEVRQTLNGSPGYDIAWDGTGTSSFHNNDCTSSNPLGLCAAN